MITNDALVTGLSNSPALYAIALTTPLTAIEKEDEYKVPTDELGVLPSILYLIDAPIVALAKTTDCALVKVPPLGAIDGAVTWDGGGAAVTVIDISGLVFVAP